VCPGRKSWPGVDDEGLLMRIDVHYREDLDTVLFRWIGQVEMAAALDALQAHFDAHNTNRSIHDLRQADFNSVSLSDLQELSRGSASTAGTRAQPRRAAIVTPGIMQSVVRLYSAVDVAESNPIDFEWFFDPAEAAAWLGLEAVPADWFGADT